MFLYLNIMVFYIYFQVWICLFTEPLTKALKECFCIIFANNYQNAGKSISYPISSCRLVITGF